MSESVVEFSHYLLYAKGHYDCCQIDGSLWGDLKKIHSYYYGIDKEHITTRDIISCLVKITEKFVSRLDLIDFLSDIDPTNSWKFFPRDRKYDYNEAIAYKCLSLLRFIPVYDDQKNLLMNLGSPDPKILSVKNIYQIQED